MKIYEVENTNMKDKVYYTLNMWTDKTKMGSEYVNIFWRKGNAKRVMQKMIDSGLYQMIVMRRNEIWFRNPTNEFSCSGVEEKWEVE